MKVFGAGFGRTGTMSLKIALEKLGFGPCYHMKEIVPRPSHIKRWYDISNDSSAKWNELFIDFNSGVDYPICLFYKDLIDTFPNAKFILTLRDFDSWYNSTLNTVYKVPTMLPDWFRKIVPPVQKLILMQNKLIWSGLFNNQFSDKEYVRSVYNNHIDNVKKTIPDNRLLLYSVSEGWAPLCEFLDVDIPEDIPFPKVNDTAEILRNFAIIKVIPYLLILLIITFLFVIFLLQI